MPLYPETMNFAPSVLRSFSSRVLQCKRNLPYANYILSRRLSVTTSLFNDNKPTPTNIQSHSSKLRDQVVDKRPMKERISLAGKTTVITGKLTHSEWSDDRQHVGGARGIGLSLVESIAQEGGDVAVLDVLEKPQRSLSELGVKAKYYRCVYP